MISLTSLAKSSESVGDVIYGLVQKHERMDLIARSMVARGCLSFVAFAAVESLPAFHSAMIAWVCAWCLVLGTYDLSLANRFATSRVHETNRRAIAPRCSLSISFRLAKLALPLGLTMMLISLNSNVPRYFIRNHAGSRVLGFFAAIASLMIAGNLVINAAGQTVLPDSPPITPLVIRMLFACCCSGYAASLDSLRWLVSCFPSLRANRSFYLSMALTMDGIPVF